MRSSYVPHRCLSIDADQLSGGLSKQASDVADDVDEAAEADREEHQRERIDEEHAAERLLMAEGGLARREIVLSACWIISRKTSCLS